MGLKYVMKVNQVDKQVRGVKFHIKAHLINLLYGPFFTHPIYCHFVVWNVFWHPSASTIKDETAEANFPQYSRKFSPFK